MFGKYSDKNQMEELNFELNNYYIQKNMYI